MKGLFSAAGRVGSALVRDPVLCASLLLAAAACFIVPPGAIYLEYIDWRVLSLLLSLMLVVAGLKAAGLFELAAGALCRSVGSLRGLAAMLVCACFFSSMLITNDVALITFVPLSIMLLEGVGQKHRMYIIILQTLAANLGSGLTPLGNPQNLYLYSVSGMSVGRFLTVMSLPTAAAAVLLCLALLFVPRLPLQRKEDAAGQCLTKPDGAHLALWLLLFVLCLLSVLRLVHYAVTLGVVVLCVAIFCRRLLLKADYALLLTFICFFIFTGSIKTLPPISERLSAMVAGHELTVGALVSQVISNVPAAMLLAGFSSRLEALLLGVNVGGMGTLIASMASIISYKAYTGSEGARPGRYIAVFTLVNLLFLALLFPLCVIWLRVV